MWSGEPDGERLVDRRRRIHPRRLVLREVLHDDVVAFDALAGVGRFFARQHPHQRRLADAVGADERDAIAALDVQVEVVEHDEVAVRLARVLQLEHRPAALARTAGKSKWIFLRSGGTSIGTTFSSILIRLCTCDAFVAW